MVQIVAEFFGICGLDVTPPDTLAALIPYLLTVLVGIILEAVFRVIAAIVQIFCNWRWFR